MAQWVGLLLCKRQVIEFLFRLRRFTEATSLKPIKIKVLFSSSKFPMLVDFIIGF
jgi:hypothetical protein